jgi:hypothetical protein
MSEKLSSFEQQREALAEKLKLREQYEQQIKTLNETGVLEILPESQELGIIGIDGKGYPMPKYEEILARITREKIELLTKKFEQGFTQLLLVPFGMPLNTIIDRYRRELLKHDSENTLLDTDGNRLELDRENPIDIWHEGYDNGDISGELIYDPKEFSQYHQGKTKEELIQAKGAWQFILTEDLPDLPAKGKGQTIAGRHQLESNKSSEQYLQAMQTDPQYQGEKGFSPEAELTLWLTTLHTKNIQIDDWQGQGKACLLTASYFKGSGFVPYTTWSSDNRRAFLIKYDSWSFYLDFSVRTRVEI